MPLPQRLVLLAVQPFLLGDRRLAIGDKLEFSTPEERKFLISNLNWTAFRPEFVAASDDDTIVLDPTDDGAADQVDITEAFKQHEATIADLRAEVAQLRKDLKDASLNPLPDAERQGMERKIQELADAVALAQAAQPAQLDGQNIPTLQQQLLALGKPGLTAIEGIGAKTADAILAWASTGPTVPPSTPAAG